MHPLKLKLLKIGVIIVTMNCYNRESKKIMNKNK